MLNFDDYKAKMSYPEKPKTPALPKTKDPEDFCKYANDLEQYAKDKKVFWDKQAEYSKHVVELERKFEHDALEDVGLLNHPKAGKAFAKAWERGHSSGYASVYYELEELAEFLL